MNSRLPIVQDYAWLNGLTSKEIERFAVKHPEVIANCIVTMLNDITLITSFPVKA